MAGPSARARRSAISSASKSRNPSAAEEPIADPPMEGDGSDSEDNDFELSDDAISEGSEPSHISLDPTDDEAADSEGDPNSSPRAKSGSKKRKLSSKGVPVKRRVKRSAVWKVFKVVEVPSKTEKGVMMTAAKCRYCYGKYAYNQGGTTSHLGRHMRACYHYKNRMARAKAQGLLNLPLAAAGDTNLPLIAAPNEYNHEQTRQIIAKMVIVHEYPFRMVEHTWFNVLLKFLNPAYQFIGRKTIRSECMKVFHSEKEELKKTLRGIDMISLTCDLWTSNQNLCYMSLVAHYIDKNWVMQCRVLNFIELDPPHKGIVISKAIFDCVTEWKIDDKIISITLDNASSNDTAVKNLITKFIARGSARFMSQSFHVRCCAHIVNLVVKDGMEPLAPLIDKLRETVKYMKKSPSRMYKFLEVVADLSLKVGPGLSLDVSTRWSSTFKMLSVCIAYKDALVSYADSDANYKWEPSHEDWVLYGKLEPILKSFAQVTTALSGSTYPTSNIFYPYIVDVKIALKAAMDSTDIHLKRMAKAMMDKFDKYWEEKNNVMVIATILDPRYKMRFITWCFEQMY